MSRHETGDWHLYLGLHGRHHLGGLIAGGEWVERLRPHYVSRGVFAEFAARVQHWRIYRFNFAYLQMDCGAEGPRPVTVLDLPEFEETPREVLAREFPECTNIRTRSLNFPYGNSPLHDWPD